MWECDGTCTSSQYPLLAFSFILIPSALQCLIFDTSVSLLGIKDFTFDSKQTIINHKGYASKENVVQIGSLVNAVKGYHQLEVDVTYIHVHVGIYYIKLLCYFRGEFENLTLWPLAFIRAI